jgi:hypothetical protein
MSERPSGLSEANGDNRLKTRNMETAVVARLGAELPQIMPCHWFSFF